MRTFSFFNEKGGVGKSLHTVLFASFLCYGCGAKVLVVDFETPSPRLPALRERELEHLKDPLSPLSRYFASHACPDNFYDIVNVFRGMEYDFTPENSEWLLQSAERLLSGSKYDYILFDFPGTLVRYSPGYDFIVNRLVDLVAVPFDTESATRKSALFTCDFLKENGIELVAFWNNVSTDEIARPNYLELGEMIFGHHDFPVLEARVKTFTKGRRDSSEKNFVRSTVCWPERYVQMSCPALLELYGSLKELLDSGLDREVR